MPGKPRDGKSMRVQTYYSILYVCTLDGQVVYNWSDKETICTIILHWLSSALFVT